MLRLLILAFPFGLLSYACTRGPDGDLFPGLWLFVALGVGYCVLLYRSDGAGPRWVLVHYAAFIAATVAPFFVPPYLEEMGGMLYVLLPAVVTATSAIAAIAVLLVRPRLASRRARRT